MSGPIAGAAVVALVMRELQVPEGLAEQMVDDAHSRGRLGWRRGIGRGVYDDSQKVEAWVATEKARGTPAKAPKNRGGAPLKYDWEGAQLELSRACARNELDCRNAEVLAKHLEAWFTERYENGGPERQEIRKHVARWTDTVPERET